VTTIILLSRSRGLAEILTREVNAMGNESKNYVPIIAALITAGATLAAGLIANWDKLFPKHADGLTYSTETPNGVPPPTGNSGTVSAPRTPTPTATATPVVSPTLTPIAVPPAPEKGAQLEGFYEFVSQNYEPRPSQSRMEISKVGDNRFVWHTEGIFGGRPFRSRGKLMRRPDGWVASIDDSDDPSIINPGPIPTELTFDGETLSIMDLSNGNRINWRRR
jgi:hypothetical protein